MTSPDQTANFVNAPILSREPNPGGAASWLTIHPPVPSIRVPRGFGGPGPSQIAFANLILAGASALQ